jgi:hypothetical protein
MKKIILCWKQKFINYPNSFWGLGDIIRGTISTYQLCKKLNIEFVLDNCLHPISKFLEYNNKEKYISSYDNILFIPAGHLITFISKFNQCNTLVFMTNEFPLEEPNTDCINFIKQILKPNNILYRSINRYIERLPTNYTIQHFRLDDSDFKINQNDDYYEKLYNISKNNYIDSDILISSSNYFKDYIKGKKYITVSECIPSHIGYETDYNKIKDTLIEFYILTKASKIKTHNQYGNNDGFSGFVNWINKIYNVEIILIK